MSEWLSTTQAAARLGVTLRTVYGFIDDGSLRAYRFGRVIRLKSEDVDAFVETCRVVPGSLAHLYAQPNGLYTATQRSPTLPTHN